jgi:hypothetical protein
MNANGLYNGLDAGAAMGVYNGTDSGARAGLVGNEQNAKLRLLDRYPGAAAAYSLRKLSVNYNGPAIRVRRSSDNAEQDIRFNGDGNLDEGVLISFVGAGNNGFVSIWYDQSGSGRNATQTTASRQPRIVSSGTVERIDNNVNINFLFNTNFIVTYYDISGQWYLFTAMRAKTLATFLHNFEPIYAQVAAGGNFGQILVGYDRFANSKQLLTWYNSILSFGTNNITTNRELLTYFKTGSTSNWSYGYFRNGAANGSFTNTNNSPNVTTNHEIGSFNNGFTGNTNLFELIIYQSDQSINRTIIEKNINSYYKIY